MPERTILRSERLPTPLGPYSVATTWGELLFVSAQSPSDPADDIAAQTVQVLEKLRVILEVAGTSFDYVLQVTCFLADMADVAAFNTVYAGHVGPDPPARSTIVSNLAT